MSVNVAFFRFSPVKISGFKQKNLSQNHNNPETRISKDRASRIDYSYLAFCGLDNDKDLKRFAEIVDEIAQSPESFSKYKEELEALQYNIFDETLTYKDKFDAGNRGQVYHLKPTKYLAKIGLYDKFRPGEITAPDNSMFSELKNWYGRKIIKCGNVEIIENADPDKNGISACSSHSDPFIDNFFGHYSRKYLPKVSAAPQYAFDSLAEEFKALNKVKTINERGNTIYYVFDESDPGNVMLIGDKFIIFDEILEDAFEDYNNLNMMVGWLINRVGPRDEVYFNYKNCQNIRNCIKKCILACEKADLPLPEVYDPDPQEPDINYSFYLAGLSNKWSEVREKLLEFRQIQDKGSRIKATEDYLNNFLSLNKEN